MCEKDIVTRDQQYRVDVLAWEEPGSTQAVIEVVHTHRCSGDKLADLAVAFGENVFEVETFDFEAMLQNFDDELITLPCVNRPRCTACTTRFEKLQAKLEEQRRAAEAHRLAAELQNREDRRLAEARALKDRQRRRARTNSI